MTASERLAALSPGNIPDLRVISAAYPEIVAVVRAAEDPLNCVCVGHGRRQMMDGSWEDCPTHAALAALDAKLESNRKES